MGVAQLGECFPSTHKALGSSPVLHRPDTVVHVYNPSTYEAETRGSEVQGLP